jgi:undecaprenyl-diphosphatase
MYTAVLTQSILGFNAGGFLATPDSLLMAGWAGAAYHVARAYEKGQTQQWLIGGAWFGFGMLSKYTMAIFAPLVFLFGLLYEKPRRQLARIWPYAGFLLGCVLFVPVILWNMEYGWSTFRHTAYQGGIDRQTGIHLYYLAEFLLSQIGLLSPLVFLLLLSTWFLPLRMSNRNGIFIPKYLFFTSFPVVALFALLSIHTRVEGNWSGPGYLTAAVLICVYVGTRARTGQVHTVRSFRRRLWPWAVGSSYFITVLIMLHVLWPILPIPVKWDRIAKETLGWREIGQRAFDMQRSMPRPNRTFLFGLRYQTASELSFYAPQKPKTVSINRWGRPNAYEYWWNDADLVGWDAVGVCSAKLRNTHRLHEIFDHVAPPQKVEIYRRDISFLKRTGEPPVMTFFLYRAYGFKGGTRWNPMREEDIRVR